jgi:hypothetical protein
VFIISSSLVYLWVNCNLGGFSENYRTLSMMDNDNLGNVFIHVKSITMKAFKISLGILLISTLFFSCNLLFDDDPNNGDTQSEVGQYTTGDFGVIATESGESVQLIPGTVPPDAEGNPATVSFTIETGVEDPGRLGDGAEFKSSLVKFGPEYFNFRWPLTLSLVYEENADPAKLAVMHFDYTTEKWTNLPKLGIDTEKRLVYFNTMQLGVFGLAELSENYRSDCFWCDEMWRFRDTNRDYFYTFTVASVANPKYEWQESWLVNPGYVAASTGVKSNQPLEWTWGTLVQAEYRFWVTRTKPGTYWELPKQETYTQPTALVVLDEPTSCLQSATTFPDFPNLCDPHVDVTLPSGGSWVEGTPDGWPVPTITYGTGDFQVTLNWVNNSSHATDLDLHLYGPDGLHVYYEDDVSDDGSLKLDRDWWEDAGSATENIYSVKDMPSGNYEVKVKLYSGDATSFNVRMIKKGEVKNYSGQVQNEGDEKTIFTFSI